MNKIISFFKEVKLEYTKVSWPSSKEVSFSAKMVFVSTILVSLCLGGFDSLLVYLMDILF